MVCLIPSNISSKKSRRNSFLHLFLSFRLLTSVSALIVSCSCDSHGAEGLYIASPDSIAGWYTTGPISGSPAEFNMTAQLFDAFGGKICDTKYLEEYRSEIEGRILFAGEDDLGK